MFPSYVSKLTVTVILHNYAYFEEFSSALVLVKNRWKSFVIHHFDLLELFHNAIFETINDIVSSKMHSTVISGKQMIHFVDLDFRNGFFAITYTM